MEYLQDAKDEAKKIFMSHEYVPFTAFPRSLYVIYPQRGPGPVISLKFQCIVMISTKCERFSESKWSSRANEFPQM